MDVFEAIEQRGSVRQFEKAEVPLKDLTRIVDAGRRAPSGRNLQPREFIIIDDPGVIQVLAVAQRCVAEASAAIAIVSDPAGKYWLEDACAAAENMLLAITALGYASVWIEGTLLRVEDEAKRILDVPEEKRLVILLPIGKPREGITQAEKKPLEEMTYHNRYGRPLA